MHPIAMIDAHTRCSHRATAAAADSADSADSADGNDEDHASVAIERPIGA